MSLEYSINNNGTPEGISVIPVLRNILSIAWFTDNKIILDELDFDF